jgi:hypothetical protein
VRSQKNAAADLIGTMFVSGLNDCSIDGTW